MQPDSIRFRLEMERERERERERTLKLIPLGATCLNSWPPAGRWDSQGVFWGNTSTADRVTCVRGHREDQQQLWGSAHSSRLALGLHFCPALPPASASSAGRLPSTVFGFGDGHCKCFQISPSQFPRLQLSKSKLFSHPSPPDPRLA